MSIPSACHLWTNTTLTYADVSRKRFENLSTLIDESHLERDVLRCKDCGQLYLYEYYEVVDWDNGNDRQYSTLIPVDSIEEAKELAKLSPIELLLRCSPRLQDTKWIGKD